MSAEPIDDGRRAARRGRRLRRTARVPRRHGQSDDRLGAALMRALPQRSTRAGAIPRRRGPRDDGRGADQPLPGRRFRHDRLQQHSPAAAATDPPHVTDGSRRDGTPAEHPGRHRQPVVHAPRCPARPPRRSHDPDCRLRITLGLGLGRRTGALDARLYRSCAGAAAVRARSSQAAWQSPALHLCRPSDRRGSREPASGGRRKGGGG